MHWNYHEFMEPMLEIKEVAGLKIAGARGIPRVRPTGAMIWADEFTPAQLIDHVFNPDGLEGTVDILVTHGPPEGILDNVNYGTNRKPRRVGATALNRVVEALRPRLHCFGHIHEEGGMVVEENGVIYSNASRTVNYIDLEM